ncbi:hypothetical protein SFR_1907 [Streptomyces sp. FR-008]|nr:hypothetical protein SFR_1907 [Streptomyces sp. FR-008]
MAGVRAGEPSEAADVVPGRGGVRALLTGATT